MEKNKAVGILKRLALVILFVPLVISYFVIQIPYDVTRYVISDREFPEPWIIDFIEYTKK